MNDLELVRTRPLSALIFASRWLQLPLYLGLIVAQIVYVYQFWKELVHLVEVVTIKTVSETEIMLIVLGLIDVVMIANLLIMVIVGGAGTLIRIATDLTAAGIAVDDIALRQPTLDEVFIHLTRTPVEA